MLSYIIYEPFFPVNYLFLKDLTLKLKMLIALKNTARVQTIQYLSTEDLDKLSSQLIFKFHGLLKQRRPGFACSSMFVKAYRPDRRLCYTVLKEYLFCTKPCRNHRQTQLLIRYVSPYMPVSRDTIARWFKVVLTRA